MVTLQLIKQAGTADSVFIVAKNKLKGVDIISFQVLKPTIKYQFRAYY